MFCITNKFFTEQFFEQSNYRIFNSTLHEYIILHPTIGTFKFK